jgi:Asp-tRNA(Asn)/Glu-tRNA(Gln) amidotransferase A subunit family amidase
MDSNYIFKNQAVSNPSPKFAFIKGPVWSSGNKDMQEEIENFVANFPMDIEAIDLGKDFKEAAKSHEIIMNGSISRSLIDYYNTDKSKLHQFTVNRIEAGIPVSAKNYIDALENAKKMKQTLSNMFKKFDAIITPAAPGQAPRDLMNTGSAIFNGYWTMMGVPAINLPLLKGKDGLPIGVQVITSWHKEAELLDISNMILKQA